MTQFAFQWSDGTTVFSSSDILVTTTPTLYSFSFRTPATIAPGSYVAITDSSLDLAGTIDVRDVKLNIGTSPTPYTIDTPRSAPAGGGGLIYLTDATPATAQSFARHYLGYLVPESTKRANQMTNAELFEQFVPYPIANATYITPILDAGFTSSFTATIALGALPGRGIGGGARLSTFLDAWNDGDQDPGIYAPFTSSTATGRYFRAMIVMDTSTPAYVTEFSLNLSSQSKTKIINNFPVDIGGTTLNFPNTFHSPPNIQITVSDGTSTSGGASQITSSSALIELFKGETNVAGTANLTLVGG